MLYHLIFSLLQWNKLLVESATALGWDFERATVLALRKSFIPAEVEVGVEATVLVQFGEGGSSLAAAAYHAYTWFAISPKAMPPLVMGGRQVSDTVIVVSQYGVAVVLSLIVLVIAL